jgi:hypothetical protein
MRYSADQQRVATAEGYYEMFSDHFKVIEKPEMVDLFLRGLEGGWDEFGVSERTKLNVFNTIIQEVVR